jgi:hypothetical protein
MLSMPKRGVLGKMVAGATSSAHVVAIILRRAGVQMRCRAVIPDAAPYVAVMQDEQPSRDRAVCSNPCPPVSVHMAGATISWQPIDSEISITVRQHLPLPEPAPRFRLHNMRPEPFRYGPGAVTVGAGVRAEMMMRAARIAPSGRAQGRLALLAQQSGRLILHGDLLCRRAVVGAVDAAPGHLYAHNSSNCGAMTPEMMAV